jgi:predicted amidophosphoribosyltransferase
MKHSSRKYYKHGKLSTWMQEKCIQCKRFLPMNKKVHPVKYCPECRKKLEERHSKEFMLAISLQRNKECLR